MGNRTSSRKRSTHPAPLRQDPAPPPGGRVNNLNNTVATTSYPSHRPQKDFYPKPERNTLTTSQGERCYDRNDHTLTLYQGKDDMDFECNDYQSLRAKMSCGHTVTPTSLMNWCQRLMQEGKTRFDCGACDKKWSCEEVYKMALMTPEERDNFDQALFRNAIKDSLETKTCPGCKSLVVRGDLNDLRVRCTVCTANKGRNYDFCWQCLKEWKLQSPYSDRCAEVGCMNQQLEILRTCPEVRFRAMGAITGCPSVRACPTCGWLVVHSGEFCKTMICRKCRVKFCFLCLRTSSECFRLLPDSAYTHCFYGVAPRQTTIPVWR